MRHVLLSNLATCPLFKVACEGHQISKQDSIATSRDQYMDLEMSLRQNSDNMMVVTDNHVTE